MSKPKNMTPEQDAICKDKIREDKIREEVYIVGQEAGQPQAQPVKSKAELKNEVKSEIMQNILAFWNTKQIIQHKAVTKGMASALNGRLNEKLTETDILRAIDNYAQILANSACFFKYKWTLQDFLKRGTHKFLDLAVAKANYSKAKPGTGTGANQVKAPEGKYKDFAGGTI